jgi:hypothetical protein
MYLYMLYAQSEILQDLNIGIVGKGTRGKSLARNPLLPLTRGAQSPTTALSEGGPSAFPQNLVTSFGQNSVLSQSCLHCIGEKKFINETYFPKGVHHR